MAVQIPFVREMEVRYGQARQVSPLIRRVLADNPGPFTYLGTGVYIIGAGEVAMIDPGPVQPGHHEVLLRALAGEKLTHIFITHTHADHSPAAHPLAAATGAKIYGSDKPMLSHRSELTLEEGFDDAFKPHVAVRDGDVFSGPGWTIEAIATPGHASNHVAYGLREENALFTGDHIMGWSTTVIVPPDGDMDAYFASLEKVRARGFSTLWPTHGPPITEPDPFIAAYAAHRLDRERQIFEQLAAGPARIPDMVAVMYAAVDKSLHPAACQSVLAHMIRLVKLGRAACEGAPGIGSVYRLG